VRSLRVTLRVIGADGAANRRSLQRTLTLIR
jgi:hypothetical protein